MEPELHDPSEFSVTTAIVDGFTVINVTGELDMSTAPELEEALVACDGNQPLVDLTALTFIDSSGLHVLLKNRTENRPAALVVTPDSNVAHVFHIVAAGKTVPICSDLDSAIQRSGDDDRRGHGDIDRPEPTRGGKCVPSR